MKKFAVLPGLICLFIYASTRAQQYTLSSPDGHLQVKISNEGSLHFSLLKDGQPVIPSVSVNMVLGNGQILGENNKVRRTVKTSVNEDIHPVVAVKNSTIRDQYNGITLEYKGNYRVAFRAYNDAAGYRFETDYPDSIVVKTEKCEVSLPENTRAWFAFNDRWMNSYEHLYEKHPLDSLTADRTTELPLLLDLNEKGKVLITESDLNDYPGLYFTGEGKNVLQSIFPPRVKTNRENVKGEGGWDRILQPASVYPYIAKTGGRRSFPWRIFAVADKDVQLLNNDIVYKLAEPNRLKEVSWIRPGQVAWDWWNHWNITGVDFKAGINTKTYEYYIDFAARNHIPYIIMDDGWYELGDLTKVNPAVDMQQLLRYANQKKVGIILWCSWLTLDNQMDEAMDLFRKWGIKGIKVDFMNRDDQYLVNFYRRCAQAAAARHMLVDFHGAHKPAGLDRTFPNVVNYEGVAGLENDKWSDQVAAPWMAVTLPYIRMFAGPMDYTPGAMRNAQKNDFKAIGDYPMSMGTRCQQLAMYVLYDAPLQMLSDNPTIYEKNKECLDFITSVPTTWDETIPLDGKVGEYVAMARKKGNEYFAAAMTNWDARDITLDLSFLPEGSYHIVMFQDGVNADRNGIDYKKVTRTVTKKDQLTVRLAPGGGWAARIYK